MVAPCHAAGDLHVEQTLAHAVAAGDFLQHYPLAALYPAGLTRSTQFALAVLVVLINVPAYYCLWRNQRTASASASPGGRQR